MNCALDLCVVLLESSNMWVEFIQLNSPLLSETRKFLGACATLALRGLKIVLVILKETYHYRFDWLRRLGSTG